MILVVVLGVSSPPPMMVAQVLISVLVLELGGKARR